MKISGMNLKSSQIEADVESKMTIWYSPGDISVLDMIIMATLSISSSKVGEDVGVLLNN